MTSSPFYSAGRRALLVATLTSLGLGCTIVDNGALQRIEGDQSDMGPGMFGAEGCGEAATPRINSLPRGQAIMVDTSAAANNVRSSCGRGTEGNDVFFAIDVEAGDYWHFHLAADPNDPNASMRDPVLYLFSSGLPDNAGAYTCADRSCDFFADRCTNSSDEHFAFVASTSGRWFLGIDDHNTGGGRYVLNAYHPSCRDGVVEHGEACDDGNEINTDACDNSCRKLIRQDGAQESIPNDNVVEANVLVFDVNSLLRIRGTVGGTVDCYPDVFALNIPDQSRLRVAAIASFDGTTETPCGASTDAPFSITLQNRTGGQPIPGGVDANGCPSLNTANLDAGEYLVTIDASETRPEAVLFWMRFELLPPL